MSKIIGGLKTQTIESTNNDPVEFTEISLTGSTNPPVLDISFIELQYLLTFDDGSDFTRDFGNAVSTTNTNVVSGTDNPDTYLRDTFAAFNGTDSFLEVSNPSVLNTSSLENTTNLTIGCWIRPSTNDIMTPIMIYNDSVGTKDVVVGIFTQTGKFTVLSNNGFLARLTINSYTLNQWVHIVFTIGNSIGGNAFYVNGSLAAMQNLNSNASYTIIPAINDTNETRYWIGYDENNGRFLNGDMDDVFISSHAYTSGEVASLYAATSTERTTSSTTNVMTITGDGITSGPYGQLLNIVSINNISYTGITADVFFPLTTGTPGTEIFNYSYSKVSSNSHLIVTFDVGYFVDGFGEDTHQSRLFIDGVEVQMKPQFWDAGGVGGGTRSSTMYPIRGVAFLTGSGTIPIQSFIRRSLAGDQMLLTGDNSLTIFEVAGPLSE